jgi:hypothetical protein
MITWIVYRDFSHIYLKLSLVCARKIDIYFFFFVVSLLPWFFSIALLLDSV